MQNKYLFYRFCKPFVKLYFNIRYKPRIYGEENIPLSGPIILCSNHIHAFDQFHVMTKTKRIINYMAKEEYFEGKFAWFFKSVGCIKVDRRIKDENAKSEAIKVLKNGGALGIFPEGTRNKTIGTKDEVDLLPFKFGAVSLAQKTNALIVPFGISGTYKKRGTLVVHIGKPIDIKNMNLEDANNLLKEKILNLMQKGKK